MSEMPVPVEVDSLEKKIKEALDIDDKYEGADGKMKKMPENVISHTKTLRVADAIAEHISEVSIKQEQIKSTTLDYGSGDTGRQSKLKLYPDNNVEKEELRNIARVLDPILEEIFPTEYLIGIQHSFKIDENGESIETDAFFLFLAYQVRCVGSPSKPAGESTETI